MKKEKSDLSGHCRLLVQGVKDAQEVLGGKWKLVIIAALYNNKKFRFMDLGRHIQGIAPKVLSKELKDLELNRIVKRTVVNTVPVTVEYELTDYGKSLNGVVEAMGFWGMDYRESLQAKS